MDTVHQMKYIKTLTNHCWHCGVYPNKDNKFRKCGYCYKVWYCSQKCQQDDWCAHKRVCQGAGNRQCKHPENVISCRITDKCEKYFCEESYF